MNHIAAVTGLQIERNQPIPAVDQAWLEAERAWQESRIQPGAYTAFKTGYAAGEKSVVTDPPVVQETNPQTSWSDENIFEVNYADNVQVQIDRTEDNKIQIRIWNINDDNPRYVFDSELPALSDCFSCRCHVGSEFLTDGYCVTCLSGYTSDEFAHMKSFTAGFQIASQFDYVDEWVRLPNSRNIDIHFKTEETTDDAEDHGKLTAWAYRRDKRVEGDVEDGIRLL